MLHTYPDSLAYDQKLQDTALAYLFSSEKAPGSFAENYVGVAVLSGGVPYFLPNLANERHVVTK